MNNNIFIVSEKNKYNYIKIKQAILEDNKFFQAKNLKLIKINNCNIQLHISQYEL